MKNRFRGSVEVTPKSNDFGVDFTHQREDGLYLGQVKVHTSDLDYTAIALVHSNMVKMEANGGYVITTSDFTPSARQYAKDLKIDLINGIELVEHWIDSMNSTLLIEDDKTA
ncbi:restriction system protein [Ornithinibacillus halophilus]|uniref:Restriction system protein n=1 Tax=Ornithinibacillus halophilus TaxID=930117 RepID=A0A1M5LL41_9BACI|nr:restriction system protein [Ornithinibacillus halophilus]